METTTFNRLEINAPVRQETSSLDRLETMSFVPLLKKKSSIKGQEYRGQDSRILRLYLDPYFGEFVIEPSS